MKEAQAFWRDGTLIGLRDVSELDDLIQVLADSDPQIAADLEAAMYEERAREEAEARWRQQEREEAQAQYDREEAWRRGFIPERDA